MLHPSFRCKSILSRWIPRHCRRYASSAKDSLAGSVGPHSRHLVLFTGRPYDTLPSHIDAVSPLYKAILERAKAATNPLSSYALAVTDSSHPSTSKPSTTWHQNANRFDQPTPDQEAYGAVIYPDRISLPFAVTQASIASGKLEDFHSSLQKSLINEDLDVLGTAKAVKEIDVFVCTHGVRDCRCGDVGLAFYEALVKEARRRRLGDGASVYAAGEGPIRVHRTTHIGGHRYAATAFTSTGDWYGLLSATDAPRFADYLKKQLSDPSAPDAIWWDKWRGRAGLSQAAQITLAERQQEKLASVKGGTSALDLLQSLKKQRKKRDRPLGDPVDVTFVSFDGAEQRTRAFVGETLMDVAKRQGLVEATCGGACECATCHVHLSSASGSLPPVPDTTDEEEDQLEFAIGADDDSRLACQVEITPEFKGWLEAGGKVRLPRY